MKTTLKLFAIAALCIALAGCGEDQTTALAADCFGTEIKDGEWQDATTNPPECIDANGKEQGQWELRWAHGSVYTGPYVNGEKHGQWELRDANGDIQTGPYVDGKQHGQWETRHVDGTVTYTNWVNGELQE